MQYIGKNRPTKAELIDSGDRQWKQSLVSKPFRKNMLAASLDQNHAPSALFNKIRNGRRGRRVVGYCNFLVLLAFSTPVLASGVWAFATEYPEDTMSGHGMATFARLVNEGAAGALRVDARYNAGIKSSDMVDAIRGNLVQGGDTFSGALGDVDPIFQLSALPFITSSIDDARRLANLSRAQYAKAFERTGQHLLYVTPWPPTGLWTREPVGNTTDLKRLTIRTYDKLSETVMSTAGAAAVNISFKDLLARLRDGSVNGVLSSGDGEAGRRIWKILPNFTAITYAVPLSFATVNARQYDALPKEVKDRVDAAASETERQQWSQIEARVNDDFLQMRANGVAIQAKPDPQLLRRLREAAQPSVAAWRKRAGTQSEQILYVFTSGGGIR